MHAIRKRRFLGAVAGLAAAVPWPSSETLSAAFVHPSGGYPKVMVIVEENRTYGQVIGSPDAPYLTSLSKQYGTATNMVANYPVGCPSLAAYILMTSGGTAGICDDRGPRHHPIAGPNIFAQLDAAHRSWHNYAEDLPSPCARKNGVGGAFLVRHTAVPYYTSKSRTCATGQVELGTTAHGALHDELAVGTLPAYSFVTPNSCNDMHGAPSCPDRHVARGDQWLARWIPRVLDGADYRAGRLVVIITFDEGSSRDNHIPTVVLSPATRHLVSTERYDHCSTLRTSEDLLGLPALGCARSATSMTAGFHL
ncbi:alkaline phosphatase family protein [Micromonosporaceae bacterium Da 78-11]